MTGPSIPLLEGAQLDHVAVAVRDPASAAAMFRDVLGGSFLMGADQPSQGFRFVQYRFDGGGKVELVTPLGDGFLTRFLDRRGEGVHHITFKIERLEEQIERLRRASIPLTMVSLDDPEWKEAFIHPSQANGVLIQLAESDVDDDTAARHLGRRFPEAALLHAQAGS